VSSWEGVGQNQNTTRQKINHSPTNSFVEVVVVELILPLC
jgi:hypothetical protein